MAFDRWAQKEAHQSNPMVLGRSGEGWWSPLVRAYMAVAISSHPITQLLFLTVRVNMYETKYCAL